MRTKLFVILLLLIFSTSPVLAARPTPTPTPPPASQLVCIDPGHGGTDTGAINQDLTEADINLQVAQLLQTKLQSAGYTAILTRTTDASLSNADRYNFCNALNASILVSIHHNGSTDPSVDYSLALYMKKPDVQLARVTVNTVSTDLGIPNNGISRFASGVLLKANMPAVISEGFFLTSSNEYNLIKTSNRLDQEAAALFNSINSYFGRV